MVPLRGRGNGENARASEPVHRDVYARASTPRDSEIGYFQGVLRSSGAGERIVAVYLRCRQSFRARTRSFVLSAALPESVATPPSERAEVKRQSPTDRESCATEMLKKIGLLDAEVDASDNICDNTAMPLIIRTFYAILEESLKKYCYIKIRKRKCDLNFYDSFLYGCFRG